MTWALNLTTWEWVGYLGWCFCIYAAYLFGYTLWRGSRPKHAERWMSFVAHIAAWKRRMKDRGRAREFAITLLLAGSVIVMLAAQAYHARSNVVEEHNVVIHGQLPDGDWQMESDEERDLVFRPCPEDEESGVEVNMLLRSAVGYVADRAVWEERGTCKSILRSDLGFWFRDAHNNFTYKRVN